MIADIVPRGILRLGSCKSPLRLEPAMMPEVKNPYKKNFEKKVLMSFFKTNR